jgi:hypothetical protein
LGVCTTRLTPPMACVKDNEDRISLRHVLNAEKDRRGPPTSIGKLIRSDLQRAPQASSAVTTRY